jgi:MFS family permease
MRLPHSLRSLSHRNLRLFFGGQCISLVGSWMQTVAQAWLVYRLTHSTELLGLVAFLSQIPVFLFGIWAGSLADRFPRRSVLLAAQVNATVQASLLAALTLSGAVRAWHVLPLSFMLGLGNAFEIPARQALLGEIAGPDMPNAVALNSSIFNAARVVGPGLAGLVLAVVGEGWCFLINALSFGGTIWALMVMELPARPVARAGAGSHLREGIAYAAGAPYVRALLALIACSAFFGVSYSALLPAFAADVLGGGPGLLGALQASAGLGALAGAVSLLVRRGGIRGLGRRVAVGATALGVGLALFTAWRRPDLCSAALALAGFGMVTQAAGTNSLLQGLAPPEMRGRVMGLFSTLFIGMTPFGALAGGFAASRFGPVRTLQVGVVVVVAASAVFHAALPRLRRTAAPPQGERPAAAVG